MSILRGLRYPTVFTFGLLLTTAIFWSLWSFTQVTFEITAVQTVPIEFTRIIADTKAEQKYHTAEIPLPPVVLTPSLGGISDPTVEITNVAIATAVDAPKVDRSAIAAAHDRDVLPMVRIEPEYPPRALARAIEGWVKVQYAISGTGVVTNVVVIESDPRNVFDAAAAKAVSRWRYNPKVEGGIAVERVGMQTILRFTLTDE